MLIISYHSLTGNDIFTRNHQYRIFLSSLRKVQNIIIFDDPYVHQPTNRRQTHQSSIPPGALKYAPEATYTAFHPPPVARKQISWPDTTRDKMAIRFPAYPIFPPFPLSPRPAIQSGHIHQASYIDNRKTKTKTPPVCQDAAIA